MFSRSGCIVISILLVSAGAFFVWVGTAGA